MRLVLLKVIDNSIKQSNNTSLGLLHIYLSDGFIIKR